jgi:hypothetical protein
MTDGTFVRFFSGMQSRMVAQRGGLGERLLTVFALKRFFQGVYSHMRAKVAARVEPSTTYGAF